MLAVAEFPEIEKSAGAMLAPYQFGSSNSRYTWHGRQIGYGVAEVTDGFKDVLGLDLVEGRWFTREDDGQNYEAVVINEDMRRDLFGDGPAIGKDINGDRTPDDSDLSSASAGSSVWSRRIAKTASSTASGTTRSFARP